MKSRIVKTNYTNRELYCVYSKEKIDIGEKYIVVFDEYCGDEIEKVYRAEYKDFVDEE